MYYHRFFVPVLSFIDVVNLSFARPVPCPWTYKPNLVAEAWHWVLGTAQYQQQGDEHHERLHQCSIVQLINTVLDAKGLIGTLMHFAA